MQIFENLIYHLFLARRHVWQTETMAFLSAEKFVPRISRTRLKRVLSAGNQVTLAVSLWALFWPRPYFLVIAICILLPVAAVTTEFCSRGRVDWEVSRRKTTPFSVATIATAPALALFVRTLTDLNILDWRAMVAWSVFGAFSIVAGIFFKDRRISQNPGQVVQIVLFAAAYSYGTLAMADVVLDNSRGSETRTEITDMRVHVSGGVKGTSVLHEVKVGPSTLPGGAEWIHVRQDVYDRLRRGQTVCIHEGRGLLAVHWFDVRQCPVS